MNICIYSKKTEPNASFKKQEHIFPAALGGIKKLPKGYVSDEINEKFSSELEIEFMREGIISIARQFVGPGTRGNISNIKKATQSKVHLMKDDDDRCTLGYIVLGKPIHIRQIIFNFDNEGNLSKSHELIFPCDIEDIESEIKKFLGLNDSITLIKDNKIHVNKVIVGIHEYQHKGKGPMISKWFIGHNGNTSINNALKDKLKVEIERLYNSSKGKKLDSTVMLKQVTSYQMLRFDMNIFFRTCAKIAFNYVAEIVGADVVLKREFNEIRNYIVNGGKNNFVVFGKNIREIDNRVFDCLSDTHAIIANFTKKDIVVTIIFYGVINIGVRIPYIVSINELPDSFNINGIVIDWKNRKEYDFLEYVYERYKGEDSIDEFLLKEDF